MGVMKLVKCRSEESNMHVMIFKKDEGLEISIQKKKKKIQVKNKNGGGGEGGIIEEREREQRGRRENFSR